MTITIMTTWKGTTRKRVRYSRELGVPLATMVATPPQYLSSSLYVPKYPRHFLPPPPPTMILPTLPSDERMVQSIYFHLVHHVPLINNNNSNTIHKRVNNIVASIQKIPHGPGYIDSVRLLVGHPSDPCAIYPMDQQSFVDVMMVP